MKRRILIVEDEEGLRTTLTDRLAAVAYEVHLACDGETGYAEACSGSYDAIILDVMLPGRSGFDVCHDLRARGIKTPIIMLTALGQTTDKVRGLNCGADDYLTKPFEMAELVARLEALTRRWHRPETIFFGDVMVDLQRGLVCRDREEMALTVQEGRLLKYLLDNNGRTVSRDELLRNVWDHAGDITSRTIDVHVSWLRQKLEPDPKHPRIIRTMHRQGYRFDIGEL